MDWMVCESVRAEKGTEKKYWIVCEGSSDDSWYALCTTYIIRLSGPEFRVSHRYDT